MRCKKCGSRIFLVDETITHLEINGEIVKELGTGDLHHRNCLRCTHPEIYKDYAHLDEGTAKDRRCCRNCVHFNDQDSTCPEGGYSEIGNADRRLSEEECNGFRKK
jgi:predicted nucleic-acid-binding Zn-ribbon protein